LNITYLGILNVIVDKEENKNRIHYIPAEGERKNLMCQENCVENSPREDFT
jgi:hypothetical protein